MFKRETTTDTEMQSKSDAVQISHVNNIEQKDVCVIPHRAENPRLRRDKTEDPKYDGFVNIFLKNATTPTVELHSRRAGANRFSAPRLRKRSR